MSIGYTAFPNEVIENIMPALSANGWKMFCFIWRKTAGWNKTSDYISYSQITDGTGIKGRATIAKVIEEISKFVTVNSNTGRGNACEFDISDIINSSEIVINSSEIEPFTPINSSEIEPFTPINSSEIVINSSVFDVKSSEIEHTKETNTKETNTKEISPPSKPKRKPPSTEKGQKHNAMFAALAKVTCIDLSVISDKDRGKINKASAVMADKYSPDDVTGFEVWWYKNDWRGQKGQPPTLEQVRSEWGKYRRGPVGNGAVHPHQPENELVADKEFTL